MSAWHARQDRNTLEADEILLNLPEGSWLRAVFTGARVSIEPTAEGARITVREGEVRIIDTGGVTRIVGRGTGETLDFTTSVENGEIVFRMRSRAAGGRGVPVRVELDLETGIPENEAQPPHGAIRWNLLIPDDPGEKPTRLKMQWIYNLDELRRSVEGDEEATLLDPWGREL